MGFASNIEVKEWQGIRLNLSFFYSRCETIYENRVKVKRGVELK